MPSSRPITDRSTSSQPARSRRGLLLLGLALLLTAGVVAVLARSGEAELTAPETARFVRVAAATDEAGSEPLRLPGLLRATDTAELAFLHAGQLAERRVRRGEQVSAGQVLALLHNPALSPGLSAAEARLREVHTELEQVERERRRIEDLHERRLVPTEELERIHARRDALRQAVEQAEARRREASEQLAEASLRAPFAGTIVDLRVDAGEFVAAGQPILTLAGNGSLEVALEIGARRVRGLHPGQTALVRESDGSISAEASLVEIGLASPGRPAPLRLRIDEAPADWRPGLGVQVELNLAEPARLSVPLPAVVDPGSGQPRIFRVVDDRAFLVPVSLGPVRAGRVAVEGALAAGDMVVVAGQGQLLDGETVRVLP